LKRASFINFTSSLIPDGKATSKFTRVPVGLCNPKELTAPAEVRQSLVTSHFISSQWYVSSKLAVGLRFYNTHGKALKIIIIIRYFTYTLTKA